MNLQTWSRTAIAAGLMVASTAWAQAVLPELLVTKTHIPDYEFDWGRDGVYCPSCNGGAGNSRIVFTDANNVLWVANVDPVTGAFVPANGQGVKIDTDAAQAIDFGNGPEWVNTQQGSGITYMKYLAGMPQTTDNAGMALATPLGGTMWSAGFMVNGMQRNSPLGSLDVNDPNPRLVYQSGTNGKAYYRYLNDPSSETPLPSSKPACSRRWVPGEQALVYTAPCLLRASGGGKPSQVYYYDLATKIEQQVTFDAAPKLHAFAWRAPEFGNDFAIFTLADQKTLQIYRRVTGSNGVVSWTLTNSITAPANMPYITSPEQFVYNGRSYIGMQLSTSSNASDYSIPTQIAMTGIDPAVPSFRMLTNDESVPRLRLDPEYLITTQGAFIYYNRYQASAPGKKVKLEGVWRVDTGLGSPTAH